MRILHVIPSLERGGAERLCIDICNGLQKIGHEVKLVIFRGENHYEELTQELDVIVIPSSYASSFSRKSILKIKELQSFVDSFNPHIIHTHLYESDLIAFQLKTSSKTAYFSHIHSNRDEFITGFKKGLKKLIVHKFEKIKYLELIRDKKVYFIAISKDCLNFTQKELKISSKKILLLPNCIDFKLFKNDTNKSTTELAPTLRLINIGRFVPKKDQAFLIDVCILLMEKKINFQLDFLGNGALLKQVKKYAAKSGVDHLVNFLGQVKHPEKHLKMADIYVHAATSEPFGLVLIEAMASGLPVITTDGGGNRDIIINGYNGFMIPERDPKAFLKKIIELRKADLYHSISQNAQDFAGKFDVEIYCEKLTSIYHSEKTTLPPS